MKAVLACDLGPIFAPIGDLFMRHPMWNAGGLAAVLWLGIAALAKWGDRR